MLATRVGQRALHRAAEIRVTAPSDAASQAPASLSRAFFTGVRQSMGLAGSATAAGTGRYAGRVAFRGWPVQAVEFFEGLAADNSKTYWAANRAVYEDMVHAPMRELLADLAVEFGPGKIFRPYRDVRFSADKSPYKTAIAASLEHGGYIQLSAQGLASGAGMYQMAPDQLLRYRTAVADGQIGEELRRLVASIERHGITVSGHETLRTVPRGYPRDHPRSDLLRYKGLVAWRQWPVAAWLGRPAAKERVVEFLRTSAPLNEWLRANVGASTAGRVR